MAELKLCTPPFKLSLCFLYKYVTKHGHHATTRSLCNCFLLRSFTLRDSSFISLSWEKERQRLVSQCDLYARSFCAVQSGSLKVNVLVPPVSSRVVYVIRWRERRRRRLYVTVCLYVTHTATRLKSVRRRNRAELVAHEWDHNHAGTTSRIRLRGSLNHQRGKECGCFFTTFPLLTRPRSQYKFTPSNGLRFYPIVNVGRSRSTLALISRDRRSAILCFNELRRLRSKRIVRTHLRKIKKKSSPRDSQI